MNATLDTASSIDERSFRTLLQCDAGTPCLVARRDGTWDLRLRSEGLDAVLATRRGPRLFGQPGSAIRLLHKFGVRTFTVDTRHLTLEVSAARRMLRPDRSRALKEAHRLMLAQASGRPAPAGNRDVSEAAKEATALLEKA